MLIQNLQKINDIKQLIKNLEPRNLTIEKHYPFNEKFQQNLINESDINLNLLNLKNNRISISFVFNINDEKYPLLVVLEKINNSVDYGFSFSYDLIQMKNLYNKNNQTCINQHLVKYDSMEEEFNNTIKFLEQEIQNKQNIVNRLNDIQKNIKKLSFDIFSFYENLSKSNTLKTIKLEKELNTLIQDTTHVFKKRCKEVFSQNKESTLIEFILQETKINSIEDLKLKYNNTHIPIQLSITHSYIINAILSDSNFYLNLKNYILLNSLNLIEHTNVLLYIKNNKMFFQSNIGNSRTEIEDVFKQRVNFKGENIAYDTVVKLLNNDNYQFFIDSEHSIHKKSNNKIFDVFYFLDNS